MPFEALYYIFNSNLDERRFTISLIHNTDTDEPIEVVLFDNCALYAADQINPCIHFNEVFFSQQMQPAELLKEVASMEHGEQKDFDVSMYYHAMTLRVVCK